MFVGIKSKSDIVADVYFCVVYVEFPPKKSFNCDELLMRICKKEKYKCDRINQLKVH